MKTPVTDIIGEYDGCAAALAGTSRDVCGEDEKGAIEVGMKCRLMGIGLSST